MPKRSKIVPCVDCQKVFPRQALNRNRRCFDCGMKSARDNMVQLNTHSGPYYDKWRKAVKAAARRL